MPGTGILLPKTRHRPAWAVGRICPLVESERGRNIGKYLKLKDMLPDVVFAAPLKRTMETARLAVAEMRLPLEVQAEDCFREVDYGPDENKPEEEVIGQSGRRRH